MQTGPDDSAVYPHLARAANEEFMPIGVSVSGGSSTPSSGWDPFEVWRSRVKVPYDARVTPHMYIIDPKGTLVYMGGIDSIRSTNLDDVPKAKPYVRDALKELASGKPISAPTTSAYGCTIKYKGTA